MCPYVWGFPGGSVVKNSPANEGNIGLIPGFRRSPGEGNGNPFQHPCLGNPMDRGAWWGDRPRSCKRVGHDLATEQQQGVVRGSFRGGRSQVVKTENIKSRRNLKLCTS